MRRLNRFVSAVVVHPWMTSRPADVEWLAWAVGEARDRLEQNLAEAQRELGGAGEGRHGSPALRRLFGALDDVSAALAEHAALMAEQGPAIETLRAEMDRRFPFTRAWRERRAEIRRRTDALSEGDVRLRRAVEQATAAVPTGLDWASVLGAGTLTEPSHQVPSRSGSPTRLDLARLDTDRIELAVLTDPNLRTALAADVSGTTTEESGHGNRLTAEEWVEVARRSGVPAEAWRRAAATFSAAGAAGAAGGARASSVVRSEDGQGADGPAGRGDADGSGGRVGPVGGGVVGGRGGAEGVGGPGGGQNATRAGAGGRTAGSHGRPSLSSGDRMSPDARQIVAVRDVFEALGPDAARRVTLLWPALVGPAEGAPLHLRAHANRELVRAALVDARRSDIALEAQAIAQRVADEGKVLRQLRSGAMLAYAEGSALRDLIAVPVTEPFAQRMDLRGRIRLYLSLLADRPVPAGPAGVAPVDPSDAAGVSSPGTCTHDAAETLGDGARHVPTTADAQAFRQPAGRRRTLLEFSAAGRGRVVELVGELGPGTDRLAVLVPGTGSGLYGYHLPHETCEDLVAADPEHRTAAVCWVGTDFPMGLLNESAQTRFALDGAPALVNTLVSLRLALAAQESETTCGGSGAAGTYSSPDTQTGHDAAVDGVDKSGRAHRRPEPDRTDHADYRPETDHTGRVNHDPESDGTKRAAHRATDPGQNGARAREPLVTVIGHSYGASLVGAAERLGLPTDQVVHLASAGAGPGVRSVRDYAQVDALGRDRAVERFACTAPGDPIRWLFGGDAPSSSRTPPAAEGADAPPAPDGSYAPSASKSPRIPRIPRRRRYALVPRRAPGCGRWPEARRRLGLRGVIRAALSGLSRAAVHTRDDLFRGDRTTPPSSVVAEPSEFSLWARFPQRQHPLVSEIRTRLSGLHLRWVGPLGADPARLAGMHSYEAGEWEAARRGAQPGEPVAGPLGHLGVITPGTTAFRRLSSIVSRR